MPRFLRWSRRVPTGNGSSFEIGWLLICFVVGLPLLVVTVALAQRNWYPTGDLAQAELRMRSLPQHPPLVGAAGRIVDAQGRQGSHPGPLMFWVTWPIYALLGRSAWALEAATALVNLAWLSISVWLVRRRAGLAVTAWYGTVCLVLIGGYGLNGLTQPWNPWVGLLSFSVLILATWSSVERARWAPALAVAAASYSIQGHIGYAPVALPLLTIAVLAPVARWWWDRRRADRSDGVHTQTTVWVWLLPIMVAVVVGLAAWSGPLLDVVRHHPDNVDKLAANFGNPSEPAIGLGRAVEAVLQSAAPAGAWMRGGEEVTGSILPGALLLTAWAIVAIGVARRGAEPGLTRLNAVLAVATVFAVFTISRIFGALYLYVFRWIVAIVALQIFALGWGLATLLPHPSLAVSRRLRTTATIGLLALSAFMSQRLVGQQIPYDQSWRMERVLSRQLVPHLDPGKRYLVAWDDPAYLGGLGFGLILDLERRGFTVGAEPRFSTAVEPRRVFCPGHYDAVLTTVTGRAALAKWNGIEGARRMAAVDLRASTNGYNQSMAELKTALAATGRQLTNAEIEQQMNLLVLDPNQPTDVAEAASLLVLGGVPSAVYLQDPPPVTPALDPNDALAEPCTK